MRLKRIQFEKRVRQIEEILQRELDLVYRFLAQSRENIRRGDKVGASKTIQNAIAADTIFAKLARKIRKIEKALLTLSKKDFRIEKNLSS